MKASKTKRKDGTRNIPTEMRAEPSIVIQRIRSQAAQCAEEDRSVGFRLRLDDGDPRELSF